MSDEPKDRKNLPAKRAATSGSGQPSTGFLAKVRAGKVAKPPRTSTHVDPALVAAGLAPQATRPRLVFAIDATASREPAWQAAQATTDALFEALPGELDVALAVHGGSRLKLFTEFADEAAVLRDQASAVRCESGTTRLLEILERCRQCTNVKVLVYVGDVFEESVEHAAELATSLRLRGTRIIVLHDRAQAPALDRSAEAFQLIAKLTCGAVLPFEPAATTQLRDMLAAIATLAVGGRKLLQSRVSQLPAAKLLMANLREE